MLGNKEFLDLCLKLSEAGLRPAFKPGEIIARGFADLGYEEFSVAPARRIYSLYTGKGSTVANGDEHHFFLVPSGDQLVDQISARGSVITTLEYRDQREWRIGVRQENGDEIQIQAPKLDLLFGRALLKQLK